MINPFPAIVIGGPPHSGKSVLTYLLTQQLRVWAVEHYVLRACPDGEGDWSQETPPERVRLLRQKGEYSGAFVDRICRDLTHRHLPLLVDVGGQPTVDQERILDACTHIALLAPDAESLALWRARAERHGLAILAELHSKLDGEDAVSELTPVLRGQICGLQRHAAAPGAAFWALAARVRDLLAYEAHELRECHLDAAPTELAVDLEQLASWLQLPDAKDRWRPEHLPSVIVYLPEDALSLYGRGPNWLYAAVAMHSAPHPFFLYDVRLGWTPPAPLTLAESAPVQHVGWTENQHPTHTHLTLLPTTPYLDYDDLAGAALPVLYTDKGVVLSGKVPHWLIVGAALAYRSHPWVAVYQPQLTGGAAIVFSRTPQRPVGTLVSSA